jgi:hypothetical protein
LPTAVDLELDAIDFVSLFTQRFAEAELVHQSQRTAVQKRRVTLLEPAPDLVDHQHVEAGMISSETGEQAHRASSHHEHLGDLVGQGFTRNRALVSATYAVNS